MAMNVTTKTLVALMNRFFTGIVMHEHPKAALPTDTEQVSARIAIACLEILDNIAPNGLPLTGEASTAHCSKLRGR